MIHDLITYIHMYNRYIWSSRVFCQLLMTSVLINCSWLHMWLSCNVGIANVHATYMTICCIPLFESDCVDLFTINSTIIASIYSHPIHGQVFTTFVQWQFPMLSWNRGLCILHSWPVASGWASKKRGTLWSNHINDDQLQRSQLGWMTRTGIMIGCLRLWKWPCIFCFLEGVLDFWGDGFSWKAAELVLQAVQL